jgi:hypothetical protein
MFVTSLQTTFEMHAFHAVFHGCSHYHHYAKTNNKTKTHLGQLQSSLSFYIPQTQEMFYLSIIQKIS